MITDARASGSAINDIVSELEPLLTQFPREHIIIACLSIAIAAQKPDLTEEELVGAVEGASRYICLYLADVSEQMAPEKMN